jgi:hypothetical protein
MSFSITRRRLQLVAATSFAAFLAACNGSSVATSPVTAPPVTNPSSTYTLLSTLTYPGVPPATGTASFDIGFVDPTASQYYVADRTTNGVAVFNTGSLTYVFTAGAGKFAGNKPSLSPPAPSTVAGPNGIVPVGNGIVFAGDGDSTMKVVNVFTGALLATVPNVNPYTGPALPAICGGAGTPTTATSPGGGNQRMDEMAYDPADGLVLGINDASCPPFGTFYSSTAPYAVKGTIAFTTATGGAEQPTWDPTQGKFIMALPSTVANPGGEIDLIDPHTFTVTKVLPETNCNANGTALGKNETLFLGCSGTSQILTINASTGATINTISGLGGCDEVWYNPTADRFYAACSNNLAGPVAVVANGSGQLVTSFATSTGAHSIAVDPVTDHIFIPTQKLGIQVYGH